MQELVNYIEQIVKLDQFDIEELERLSDSDKYAKNEHILEVGHRCNNLWFLKKGMVRKYHHENGKEITCWIHTENEIFTSLQSYSEQRPTSENIQACENTELISITRANAQELAKIPQFRSFSNALMEKAFVDIDVHTKAFNARDAKGKYEYLKQIAPEMIKRSKLGYIASILGISQETLSRIRKS